MKTKTSILGGLSIAAVLAIGGAGACGGDDSGSGTSDVTSGDGGTVLVPATCSGTMCSNVCVDTQKDPDNCGACAKACGGGEVCSAGACALSCGGGTTRCGSTCEDLTNDAKNCGACGNACPAGTVCGDGKCGLVCTPGFTKCGGGGGDGGGGGEAGANATCADLTRDPAHCGDCAVACTGGQTCSSGHCCASNEAYCSGSCMDVLFDKNNCGSCGNACAGGTPVCGSGACIGILASCKAIKTARPTAADGVYTIDPDGASTGVDPFDVYCDMTTDGGGWTLIESTAGGAGPSGLTQGEVLPGSATYMPNASMVALATIASQVHVRSPGAAATQSITSTPDSEPIANLRLEKIVNVGLAGTDQLDRWTGPMATPKELAFNCPPGETYPSIYHACGNSQGIHLVTTHSRWDWSRADTALNVPMEVYVR